MIGDEASEKMTHYAFHAGARLTEEALRAVFRKVVKNVSERKETKQTVGEKPPEELAKDNSQISCIEVQKKEVAGFDQFAKHYGLTYSLIREKNDPTHYVLSFKTKDYEKLLAAGRDFLKSSIDHGGLAEKLERAAQEAMTMNKTREKARGPRKPTREVPSV